AAVVGIDDDVVALRIGRPEADSGLRLEPVFLDDAVEHLAGVDIQRARDFADLCVVEYLRKASGQFPGLDARGPVAVLRELGELVIPERLDAQRRRLLRRRFGEIDADRVGAGL